MSIRLTSSVLGRILVAAWIPVTLASCAGQDPGVTVLQGPEPNGKGVFSFALSSAGSALGSEGLSAFKIALYESTPASIEDKADYRFDCTPMQTDAFVINKISTGRGFTLVFEGYEDPDCGDAKPAALGVRGGITITEDGTGDAFYYIQVNTRGRFNAFPLPDPVLSGKESGVTCTGDADCRKTVACAPDENCPNGVKYQVHPQAVCDKSGGDTGICRLTSLFPLNSRLHRVMHAALPAPDGRVLSIGGFNSSDNARFTVDQDALEEWFDGSQSLFSEDRLGGLENRSAMSVVVPMGGDRAAIVGGVFSAGVKDMIDILTPGAQGCAGGACDLELSDRIVVVDLAFGGAREYSMPVATAGMTAGFVGTPDGGRALLVRTGLTRKDNGATTASNQAFLFAVADDGSLSCVSPGPQDTPDDTFLDCMPMVAQAPLADRAWGVGDCLQAADDGTCSTFAVLGGNKRNAGPQAFAEIYDTASGTIVPLGDGGGLPPTLGGARAVVRDGRVWTIGGIVPGDGPGADPFAGPMVFSIDMGSRIIRGAVPSAQADIMESMRRMLHSVLLLDGMVLVAGGIRDEVTLDSWQLLDLANGSVSVLAEGAMNQPRMGHRATRITGGLLDGAVLVTGGLTNPDGPDWASAELYLP